MDKPYVSIIVPVYNGSDKLLKCLDSLAVQTYPENRFEIIVVDNGSSENIRGLTERYANAVYLYESRAGSYAARNKGIGEARGEILAFLDSDCIAFCDWLEEGAAAFMKEDNCGLITGKVHVFPRDPDHPSFVELYEMSMTFKHDKQIKISASTTTATLFTGRAVFDEVGLFDPSMLSGGDQEWSRRVHDHGFKLVYSDKVQVYHPARGSLRELYMKAARIAGGYGSVEKTECKSGMDIINKLGFYLRYTMSDISDACSAPELGAIISRVMVILLILFTRVVFVVERLRIALGGIPRR